MVNERAGNKVLPRKVPILKKKQNKYPIWFLGLCLRRQKKKMYARSTFTTPKKSYNTENIKTKSNVLFGKATNVLYLKVVHRFLIYPETILLRRGFVKISFEFL